MLKSLQLAKEHFPNLRIAYLSSRVYGGYATVPLNPEPYAYEGAFAVRWLILDQLAGKPELNDIGKCYKANDHSLAKCSAPAGS